MGTMTTKELDAKIRSLKAKTLVEETEWLEQGRRLYEYEETLLRDTFLEGNILMGWGEPRTAPVRLRNARVRKRKRERQEVAEKRSGKLEGSFPPILSIEEELKIDRYRLASYSSVESPAEPLYATLKERGQKLMEAKINKLKRPAGMK